MNLLIIYPIAEKWLVLSSNLKVNSFKDYAGVYSFRIVKEGFIKQLLHINLIKHI
jgi:hypothetical protein